MESLFQCEETSDGANHTYLESDHICQYSSQDLFVSDEVIARTNTQLSDIKSFIRLQKRRYSVGTTMLNIEMTSQSGLKLYAVEPVLAPRDKFENVGYHEELYREHHRQSNSFNLWTDCYRASALVAGSTSDNIQQSCLHLNDISPSPEWVISSSPCPENMNATPFQLHAALPNIGQRLGYSVLASMHTFFMDENDKTDNQVHGECLNSNDDNKNTRAVMPTTKLPNFKGLSDLIGSFDTKTLKKVQTVVKQGCIDSRSIQNLADVHKHSCSNDYSHVQDDICKRWKDYGDMYLRSNSFQKFKSLGINEHVDPAVGDVLCTIPAVLAPQWSRWIESSYNPNFHFAGVIIVNEEIIQKDSISEDQAEGNRFNNIPKYGTTKYYVTLENWAVENPQAVNSLWGFRCYQKGQKEDKSYHRKLVNSDGYGNIALTFGLKKMSPESSSNSEIST